MLIHIALGTTSKQKIEYVEEVMKQIHISATLYPSQAESGVAEQPCSS
ncbi:hypothetical protein [Caldalkalibacillus mannanilyticus]|nr:hypothetical protein [Caldalkalibacillus mannanilyticus]